MSFPSVEELLVDHKKLQEEFDFIKTKNESLLKRIQLLEESLRLAKSKRFGSSSEKHDPGHPKQSSLFDEDEEHVEAENNEQQQETITYTRKKATRNKPLDTSSLPREVNTLDLTEEDKICACGCEMKKFGEDSREELVYQPAVLKVIEHVRPKYTCKHCESVKAAPALELPLPKSKASAELLAAVILNKYHFHRVPRIH